MALFLALLEQPNYSGLNWKQYIEATIQYNVQQTYKQAIINIQRQKELEINSSEFQTTINRQNNQKLNINNDKIYGAVDLQMIGLNNLAKIEGIKETSQDNSKVRFIAVEDEVTTKMCQSLDGQEFYMNKENVFDRYYRGTNTGEAHKGSGLGMSIAKEIVNAHNGDITINSILGKGTDINITL